jgi:hypothetical protein
LVLSGHHQPRGAVGAGAHDFIAQDAVTDIDRISRRSGDADDLILDDDRFTDARLRVSRTCSTPCKEAKRGERKNAVTQIHFMTDRFIPLSYRSARAHDVVNLSQAAPYQPDG